VLGVLFFVPAMNLAGIPPMSGFLGKVSLTRAGIEVGTPLAYAVVAGGMITSLLTLYAVAKTWNLAFWRTPLEAHERARELSELSRRAEVEQAVRRHRGHVHVGTTTYAVQEQEEARSIHDDEDGTSQDLHQLTGQGLLPTRLPRTMVGATAGLVAVSLALTIVAGPLFGYTERAAEDIGDRQRYISSVLPEGSM
jgi:multicomponent Na+:H+ antiporter subunit D